MSEFFFTLFIALFQHSDCVPSRQRGSLSQFLLILYHQSLLCPNKLNPSSKSGDKGRTTRKLLPLLLLTQHIGKRISTSLDCCQEIQSPSKVYSLSPPCFTRWNTQCVVQDQRVLELLCFCDLKKKFRREAFQPIDMFVCSFTLKTVGYLWPLVVCAGPLWSSCSYVLNIERGFWTHIRQGLCVCVFILRIFIFC